jgi:RNA polymerase sigma factor (sigma-70 family)
MARGDPEAVGEFYELWFDRAYAMVRFLSKRDEAFCLDVVQDGMLKIVRAVRRFDDAAALARWIARILHTTTIDSLRREARRKRHEREAAVRRGAATTGRAPAERLELQDHNQWLQDRLAELPEEEQRLLVHRFGLGQTLRSVGAVLGISGDAAHGKIRRLLARLRASAGKVV